jgi:hypothetical protein
MDVAVTERAAGSLVGDIDRNRQDREVELLRQRLGNDNGTIRIRAAIGADDDRPPSRKAAPNLVQ